MKVERRMTPEKSVCYFGEAHPVAPVAQLDRASGYEPEGRMFESCRAHHLTRNFHNQSQQSRRPVSSTLALWPPEDCWFTSYQGLVRRIEQLAVLANTDQPSPNQQGVRAPPLTGSLVSHDYQSIEWGRSDALSSSSRLKTPMGKSACASVQIQSVESLVASHPGLFGEHADPAILVDIQQAALGIYVLNDPAIMLYRCTVSVEQLLFSLIDSHRQT